MYEKNTKTYAHHRSKIFFFLICLLPFCAKSDSLDEYLKSHNKDKIFSILKNDLNLNKKINKSEDCRSITEIDQIVNWTFYGYFQDMYKARINLGAKDKSKICPQDFYENRAEKADDIKNKNFLKKEDAVKTAFDDIIGTCFPKGKSIRTKLKSIANDTVSNMDCDNFSILSERYSGIVRNVGGALTGE